MHTPVGAQVYGVKYGGQPHLIPDLVDRLAAAFARVPLNGYGREYVLSYIPISASKTNDLPEQLVTQLSVQLAERSFFRKADSVVRPTLNGSKPAFKDLPVNRKFEEWGRIYHEDSVTLSQSVEDCVVYVIDDLYQSGATLWSYARFLKDMGASAVRGLVCEKSWSDGDNR